MSRYISMAQSMKNSKLLLYVLFLAHSFQIHAQGNVQEPPTPQKYVAVVSDAPKLTFFQGFTLSADIFGPAQYVLSDDGNFEGALRFNLKNTFFPAIELGYGLCDSEDANTHIRYKVQAPYLRIGLDYNLLRNKFQDNLLYAGIRYALSRYSFDISGPGIVDPIWGGSESFSYKDIATTTHWIEILFGVQVKVWRNFHMGWTVRYKRTLYTTSNRYASPYYIPGYGTTTHTTSWGATYNLVFDLNWGKRKKAKNHTVTIIERPIEQPIDSVRTDTVRKDASPTDSISTP